MEFVFANLLELVNETLASAIVIVAASLLLYNLSRNLQNRVARTSAIVLGCVTATYLCDVLLSLDPSPGTFRGILRLQWIGIAFLPVALVHLSDALLATTGLPSRGRRRRVIRILYAISAVFLIGASFTNVLIQPVAIAPEYFSSTLYSLQGGPLFWLYTLYFLIATVFAVVNIDRARQRCLTRDTRRRMGYLEVAIVMPALGIYPFSVILGAGNEYTLTGLVVVNIANFLVILLLAFLAYPLAFFGSRVPDRVVKTDLLRFFLRGPMTGVLALVTILYAPAIGRWVGIPYEQFTPFAVVAVVLLWQWFIALALPYLERWLVFTGEDSDSFSRLQTMSDRLLTRDDYVQLLEATLASICEYLRVGSAAVISLLEPEPEIIASIGPLKPNLANARHEVELLNDQLASADETPVVIWGAFWACALSGRSAGSDRLPIGILVIQARATTVDLTDDDHRELSRWLRQADQTLEDLSIQNEVLMSLEGLLPQIGLTAEAREEIEYMPGRDAGPVGRSATVDSDREQFVEQVRAALRHYWGGPGLTNSRLLDLMIVRNQMAEDDESAVKALRAVLLRAIEAQKPAGERRMTSPEWTLYNILDLRFIRGEKVKDVGSRLAMSDADLYRKQRVAIEAVADWLAEAETGTKRGEPGRLPA